MHVFLCSFVRGVHRWPAIYHSSKVSLTRLFNSNWLARCAMLLFFATLTSTAVELNRPWSYDMSEELHPTVLHGRNLFIYVLISHCATGKSSKDICIIWVDCNSELHQWIINLCNTQLCMADYIAMSYNLLLLLTSWGLATMADTLQATFLKANYFDIVWINFHRRLFLTVHLTIYQHWFNNRLCQTGDRPSTQPMMNIVINVKMFMRHQN